MKVGGKRELVGIEYQISLCAQYKIATDDDIADPGWSAIITGKVTSLDKTLTCCLRTLYFFLTSNFGSNYDLMMSDSKWEL